MDCLVLAYLAGALDSDGWFGIKKSTYHRRVRQDAINATYHERVGLKQVTPDIPALLSQTFGGSIRVDKPYTVNSKPLYTWHVTNRKAAAVCTALLPYLRVKRAQAEVLLTLRSSHGKGMEQVAYWFAKEFPHWPTMELLTAGQVAEALQYTTPRMVSQAIKYGTLLAIPYTFTGKEVPRIPKLLVERLMQHRSIHKKFHQADELVRWREELYQTMRELNKNGLNGTPVYHRTGHYTLKD